MDFALDLILLSFSFCQTVKADSFSPQGLQGLDAEISPVSWHHHLPQLGEGRGGCGQRRRRAEAELGQERRYRPCALNILNTETEDRIGAD